MVILKRYRCKYSLLMGLFPGPIAANAFTSQGVTLSAKMLVALLISDLDGVNCTLNLARKKMLMPKC